MAKKEKYVNYSDAIKAHDQRQQQENPLFTDEELRRLAPHSSNSSRSGISEPHARKNSASDHGDNTGANLLKAFVFLISSLCFLFLVTSMYSVDDDETTTPSYAPRQLTNQQKINQQFSSWDGHHYELVRLTKAAMHDPKSFEHVSTSHRVYKDDVLVSMKYRGNNLLGAKVINEAVGRFTINGDRLEFYPG